MKTKELIEKIAFLSPILGSFLLLYFIFSLKIAIGQISEIPPAVSLFPSQIIYWAGLVLIVLPIVFLNSNKKVKIFSLVIFSVFIFFSYPIFSAYRYPIGRDPIYTYQLSEEISNKGYWDTKLGTGQAEVYSHYPALFLLMAIASKTTNVPLLILSQWILGIIRFFTISLLIFLIYRRFLGYNLAILGVFLYLVCPSLINFPHYEGFAMVFLLAILYLLIKLDYVYNTKLVLVSILFSLLLVLSHHFTAYVWLLWLITLFVFLKISKMQRVKSFIKWNDIDPSKYVYISNNYVILFLVLFLVWGVYIAYLDVVHMVVSFKDALIDLLSPIRHDIAPKTLAISFNPYEKFFIYSSLMIMFSYLVYGMLTLAYKKYRRIPLIIIANFIFCSFLVLASLAVFATSFYFVLLRIFEFAYIGLIPIAVLGISALNKKGKIFSRILVPASLIILMIGGILLSGADQRYYYIDRSSISNDNPLFLSPKVYEAARWFKGHYSGEEGVLGDSLVFDAFGGLGHSDVRVFPKELINEVFSANEISETMVNELKWGKIKYVVTHKYMTKYPAYGISEKIYEEKQINKFENSSYFTRIFDDNTIQIYKLNLRGERRKK